MVGFALAHIYPAFFVLGAISASLLTLWLIPAGVYSLRRRDTISVTDVAMIIASALVAAILLLPDTFFAR